MESIRALLFIVLIILTAFVIYKLCLENKISGGSLESRMREIIENKESNSKVVNDTRKFVETINDGYLKEAIAHLALVEGYHFIKEKGDGVFKVRSPRGLISYIKIENNVNDTDNKVICNSNQVHNHQYDWNASHYYKITSEPSTISIRAPVSSTIRSFTQLNQSNLSTGSLHTSSRKPNLSTKHSDTSSKTPNLSTGSLHTSSKTLKSNSEHSDDNISTSSSLYVAASTEVSATSNSDI